MEAEQAGKRQGSTEEQFDQPDREKTQEVGESEQGWRLAPRHDHGSAKCAHAGAEDANDKAHDEQGERVQEDSLVDAREALKLIGTHTSCIRSL